jgi:hypothetical protein
LFGATDEITILGAARFVSTDVKAKWDVADITDNQSKNKLDLFAIGARWKFFENDDWIGNVSASYQKLVDLADTLVGEVRVGFKNDDTIIYALGRAYYFDWESTGYGFGLTAEDGSQTGFMLSDASSSVYYSVGVGMFAALGSDWSVDGQLIYTDADWHRQVAALASVSYQPWRNAAISIYGRYAIWDSANNHSGPIALVEDGVHYYSTAEFSGFTDMSAGITLTLLF